MGQYKVPQDVEAEDKILGPLTVKQFIYAIIGVMWGAVCYVLFSRLGAPGYVLIVLVGAPVVLLFMLLAFYRRDGQNFEQFLIALVGYVSQSRRRTWRKEEVVESFHVTPRAVEQEVSQRNPAEVRSQLERIGTMIDSRGWNAPQDAGVGQLTMPADDRLVIPVLPPATPEAAAPEPLPEAVSPMAAYQSAGAPVTTEAPAEPAPVPQPTAAAAVAPQPAVYAPVPAMPQPAQLGAAAMVASPAPAPVMVPAGAYQPAVAGPTMSGAVTAADATQPDILDLQRGPLGQNLAGLIQDAAEDMREEALEHMQQAAHEPAAQPVAAPATGQPTGAPAAGHPHGPFVVPGLSVSVTKRLSQPILSLATERDDLTVSQVAATAARVAPLAEGATVELRNHAQ